jgi:RNA polymerase sigma-70 factor, ECF subfamily
MAVGGKRGSRPASTGGAAGAESPVVRGEDGQPGAAAVDGLLLRVARGDAKAFAGVYDQVAGPVYGLVSRIVEDPSQAEQVAAEVLVEARRSASRFSPAEGSGLTWIMTMARRRAMSHAGEAGDGLTTGPGPSGVAERAGESLLAHRGLASLSGPQREAVLLVCCGYTYRQVAELVGVPASTVAERLREGLLRLSSRSE